MRILERLFPRKVEARSAPTTWDLLRADFGSDAGAPVSPHLAENIAAVMAAVQCISETVASIALHVYRRLPDGGRVEVPDHPVARLFAFDPNDHQTTIELIEQQTAFTLLWGNSFAQISRDSGGQPVALDPLHPNRVAVVRIPRTDRVAYDVSFPEGGTRRLLPEEMMILRDRSDDGVTGKSRLHRARESFGIALAGERFAGATFRNGANMSGVLSHPEALGQDAADRLRKSFEQTYSGSDNAGKIAVLEEGLRWTKISCSPADAEMLASRRFTVEQIARIFRLPPAVLGQLEGANYASLGELNRWFIQYSIVPWLRKWEATIERSLFSADGRRLHCVEFDTDELLRGDPLTRLQSYRIGREIGLYSANDLRRFETLNPRTDADADVFLSPLNMASEQVGRPRADRGGGDD